MKILALPALYLVYKGLTTGAGSPVSPVPETPEEKRKREEQRKEDEKAIERQKEEDEAERVKEEAKREEQRKEDEKEVEEQRKEDDDKFRQEQIYLAAVPNVTCAPNKKPQRYGFGTRANPYYWVCEVKKLGL